MGRRHASQPLTPAAEAARDAREAALETDLRALLLERVEVRARQRHCSATLRVIAEEREAHEIDVLLGLA